MRAHRGWGPSPGAGVGERRSDWQAGRERAGASVTSWWERPPPGVALLRARNFFFPRRPRLCTNVWEKKLNAHELCLGLLSLSVSLLSDESPVA